MITYSISIILKISHDHDQKLMKNSIKTAKFKEIEAHYNKEFTNQLIL